MFPISTVVTLGTTIVLVAASYFGSLNAQERNVSEVKKDVAVLIKSDSSQDKAIDGMKSDIEYIRRVVEEQARRQGIVIKE